MIDNKNKLGLKYKWKTMTNLRAMHFKPIFGLKQPR